MVYEPFAISCDTQYKTIMKLGKFPFRKKISELLGTKNSFFEILKRILASKTHFSELEKLPAWGNWKHLMDDLDWLHGRLRDEHSRIILENIVLYHLSNGNWPLRWRGENLRWLPPILEKENEEKINITFMDWVLQRRSLYSIGLPMEVFLPNRRPSAVIDLEQYADPRNGLCVMEGDVVIDGGGCWGDSALYFAHLAGVSGQVYTFEFLPENLSVMKKNLELNRDLEKRITVIEQPLWSTEGKEMVFICDGPATRMCNEKSGALNSLKVQTTTLDGLYSSGVLEKVDFIKFDIEGAELEALKGAENVIKRFRPLMALCVYHCPEHFTQLARFVDELHPDYYFSLDHMSNSPWETVLYASPR